MSMQKYGIKLTKFNADMETLKLLRKLFPNRSISELQDKIHARDYVFLSDEKEYNPERHLAELLREFDNAGIGTRLFVLEKQMNPLVFRKSKDTSEPWQEKPINRSYLVDIIQNNQRNTLNGLESLRRKLKDIEHTLNLLS